MKGATWLAMMGWAALVAAGVNAQETPATASSAPAEEPETAEPPAEEAKQPFSLDRLMNEVSRQLDVAGQELEKLKPALQQKSEELSTQFDQAVEQGYVWLDEFSQQAQSSVSNLVGELDQILEDPQVEKLQHFLENMDENMAEGVIDALVAQMAKKLELTPEQQAEAEPILREDIQQTGVILEKAWRVGMAAAHASLTSNVEEQWTDVRDQLDDILTEEQLQKADAMQTDLSSKLIKVFEPRPAPVKAPPEHAESTPAGE